MKKCTNFPDCWSDDQRMRVLFSEFRQRAVNPENYDGKFRFWRTLILQQGNSIISLKDLQYAFERNGERPRCLPEVIQVMLSAGELRPMEQFLQDRKGSWSAWAGQMFQRILPTKLFSLSPRKPEDVSYVVLDIVNAQSNAMLRSLENQIVSVADIMKQAQTEWNISEETLHIVLHELRMRQKIETVSLQDQHVLKFGTLAHKAFAFTDMEKAIYNLELSERQLIKAIGRMEEESHEYEESARKLLREKKRALAKNSLRQRDMTMRRIEKRVHCLENVQELINKIHEVANDAAVLDAYRTGTKSLQKALGSSGITLDTVDEAIAEMQDVMELHDEVKNAMARDIVEVDEEDLEKELEELVKNDLMKDENELEDQLKKLTVVTGNGEDDIEKNESEVVQPVQRKKEAECL